MQVLELGVKTGLTDMLGGTLLYDVIGDVSVLIVYLPVSLSPWDQQKFKFVLKLCFLINCKYFKSPFAENCQLIQDSQQELHLISHIL